MLDKLRSVSRYARSVSHRDRFPFIFQSAANDCAPACILALALHYGIDTTLDELRDRLNADPKIGVRIKDLCAGLNGIFDVTAGKVDPNSIPAEMFPFLAFLPDEKHFVVLWERGKKGDILVGDPGIGMLWMAEDELRERWGGIVVVVRKAETARLGLRRKRTGIVWGLLRRRKGGVAALLAVDFFRSAVGTAFSIAIPLTLNHLDLMARIAGACFMLAALLGLASNALGAAVRRDISSDLGKELLGAFPFVDRRYYTMGDLTTRFSDIQTLAESLSALVRDLPYAAAMFVMAGSVLAFFDWRIAASLTVLLVALVILIDPCVRMARSIGFRLRLRSSRLTNQVRAFWDEGVQGTLLHEWEQLVTANYSQSVSIAPATAIIAQFMPLGIAVFAFLERHKGDPGSQSGVLLALLAVMGYFVASVTAVYSGYVQWQGVQPAIQRVTDFMESRRRANVEQHVATVSTIIPLERGA